jgi:hypothetical protein
MIDNELRVKIIEEYSKIKSIKRLLPILKVGSKTIKKVLIEENLYTPKVYEKTPVDPFLLKIGDKIGRWTVMETNVKTNDKGRYMTKVMCECGTEGIIRTQRLLDNKSFGCKHCVNKNNYPTFRKTKTNPDINLKGLSQLWLSSIKSNLNRGINRKLLLEIDNYDLLNQLEKQNFKCAYTGIYLNVLNTTKGLSNASLDRIDSTKGYTKDNIQWVYKSINRMKNAFSEKEFLNMCFKIYKFRHDNFEPNSSNGENVDEEVQRLTVEEPVQ